MSAMRKSDPNCVHGCLVQLYADGELEPARTVEMEQHLGRCAPCNEELALLKALRKSLRRSTVAQAPAALRERLQALAWQPNALAASSALVEDQTSIAQAQSLSAHATTKTEERASRAARVSWSVAMAMSAAACFALGYFAVRAPTATARASKSNVLQNTADGSTFGERGPLMANAAIGDAIPSLDSVIDQLVSLHANPIPPETTDPNELKNFDPYVGVPVRRPRLSVTNASFLGARMHALRDTQRTAALEYKVNGHRLTIYVFDSRLLRLTPRSLRPRVVESRPVFVGQVRGYSVAAAEAKGVGYALASDLDEDKSAQAVAAFY